MKYYVDKNGNYLGGWDDNPPKSAIEVESPPYHASQIWKNGWQPLDSQVAKAIVDNQRRVAYKAEAEDLRMAAEYKAILENAVPDYTDFQAKVAEINSRYPYTSIGD